MAIYVNDNGTLRHHQVYAVNDNGTIRRESIKYYVNDGGSLEGPFNIVHSTTRNPLNN